MGQREYKNGTNSSLPRQRKSRHGFHGLARIFPLFLEQFGKIHHAVAEAQQFNDAFFQAIKNEVIWVFSQIQRADARQGQVMAKATDLRHPLDVVQAFFKGLIPVGGDFFASFGAEVVRALGKVGKIKRAIDEFHLAVRRAWARRTPCANEASISALSKAFAGPEARASITHLAWSAVVRASSASKERRRRKMISWLSERRPVSYTHLTLPTIYSV